MSVERNLKAIEMIQPKVIITGKHTEEFRRKFLAIPGCRIVFAEKPEDIRPEDLSDTQIVVGNVSPGLVEKMPSLRFVQLYSAGATGYSWLPEQIWLSNAYGAYGDSIAEHMLAATLMAMKRLPEYLKIQERRGWELLKGIDRFEGSKVLSVGMGAIGTAYVKRAAALGAECYGICRTAHEAPSFVKRLTTPDQMDELLPEMDVVALSLPGTEEVKGMFDERRLKLMKKTAILLNTGRGNAVVTGDLIRVMKDGHLKAACLDVMDPEPLPANHPLWETPRVYLTPHISGGYRAGVNYGRVIDTVIQNLSLVLEGEKPLHLVDRKLGY